MKKKLLLLVVLLASGTFFLGNSIFRNGKKEVIVEVLWISKNSNPKVLDEHLRIHSSFVNKFVCINCPENIKPLLNVGKYSISHISNAIENRKELFENNQSYLDLIQTSWLEMRLFYSLKCVT